MRTQSITSTSFPHPQFGIRAALFIAVAAVCILGSGPNSGAKEAKPVRVVPVAPPEGSIQFNLDFPGGTVQELAEAVGALQSGTVQVMYPRLLRYKVPAFSFHDSAAYGGSRRDYEAKQELSQKLERGNKGTGTSRNLPAV